METLWKLSYTLEDNEIESLIQFVFKKATKEKRMIQSVVLFLLTVLFVASIFFAKGQSISGLILLAAISFIAFVAVVLEPILMVKKSFKQAVSEKKESVLKGTEAGIYFKSSDGFHLFNWNEILVGKLEEMYLLRLPTGLVVGVPFRVLDEISEKSFEEHVQEEKILRKQFRR